MNRRDPRSAILPIALLLLFLATIWFSSSAAADPTGASIVSNLTEYAPVQPVGSSTTAGGSFTTLLLNATSQTPRWKAYVGNVSGIFTLDDADNYTIYDWTPTTFTGEVFASRNNDVNWSGIRCARNATIIDEHDEMNMTGLMVDNINKTFNESIHAEFYIGSRYFSQSSCYAIATFVNDTRQSPLVNAYFQEVLLDDKGYLVYAALLENALLGFDNGRYDFQMIVPESDVQSTPHTYYFYTELG